MIAMLEDVDRKLDPELRRVLIDIESAGEHDRTVPVLIEPVEQVFLAPEIDTAKTERLQAQQEAIARELQTSGVPEKAIERFALVSALSADLTLDQIVTIARRSDVKIVRFGGQAQVGL